MPPRRGMRFVLRLGGDNPTLRGVLALLVVALVPGALYVQVRRHAQGQPARPADAIIVTERTPGADSRDALQADSGDRSLSFGRPRGVHAPSRSSRSASSD